jgi:hypothetical protein
MILLLIGQVLASHQDSFDYSQVKECRLAIDRLKYGPAYWNMTNNYTDWDFKD